MPLAGALKRKQPNRYGDLDLPYVVAVSETSLFPFDDAAAHRANVMFGIPRLDFSDGSGPRWVRGNDGVWQRADAGPRNRRLAAVLFASRLTPWTVGQADLEWWDNPFASCPVPDSLVPDVAVRRQPRPGPAGEIDMQARQPVRTPSSVLA